MPIAAGDSLPDVNGTVIADGRPGPANVRELVARRRP